MLVFDMLKLLRYMHTVLFQSQGNCRKWKKCSFPACWCGWAAQVAAPPLDELVQPQLKMAPEVQPWAWLLALGICFVLTSSFLSRSRIQLFTKVSPPDQLPGKSVVLWREIGAAFIHFHSAPSSCSAASSFGNLPQLHS